MIPHPRTSVSRKWPHHKGWKGQREEVELKEPRKRGRCVGVKTERESSFVGSWTFCDLNVILPKAFQQCLLVAKARHKSTDEPRETAEVRAFEIKNMEEGPRASSRSLTGLLPYSL